MKRGVSADLNLGTAPVPVMEEADRERSPTVRAKGGGVFLLLWTGYYPPCCFFRLCSTSYYLCPWSTLVFTRLAPPAPVRPSAAVLAEHGVDMAGDSLSKNPWSRDVSEDQDSSGASFFYCLWWWWR